jgi:hypothetical protein
VPNEPSLWELRNLIERNHVDTREDYADLKNQIVRDMSTIHARLDQFLPREVFEARDSARQARHDALVARVAELETGQKNNRSSVRTAIYAAVAAVAASVVTAIIVPVLTKGS